MVSILVVIAAAAALTAVLTAVAFQRRIVRDIDALAADAPAPRPQPVTAAQIDRLPAPVQRWLRYSGVVGMMAPSTVRLRQHGDFNLGRGWKPFNADQYFTIDAPEFVWTARFRMAPLVSIAGRDRYRAGVGSIDMRVLSLVPVAKKSGGGLNQGAMLRFLGEMQWFPAAALSDYITWEHVDDVSARATMQHGGIAASMTFTFGADGRLIEERASRYNDARARDEIWVNRNDSDREFGGVRVPATGEARWEYSTDPFPYIRWTITSLDYDTPARYRD